MLTRPHIYESSKRSLLPLTQMEMFMSQSAAKPAHHTAHGFCNSDGSVIDIPFTEMTKWMYQKWRQGLPKPPRTLIQGYHFPMITPSAEQLAAPQGPTVTWLGHATVLIQINGLNIITDPHFSKRASPLSWSGPERKTPLPLTVEQLPHIDIVVISHNHYDHLDEATVKTLANQPGGAPHFYVPLGVDKWFHQHQLEPVITSDWWQQRTFSKGIAQAVLTLVPAHHWSARSMRDRNHTLWGGWVISSADQHIYFAGDTGYSDDFKTIGERLGPFDMALLPIGAYEPRWFMKNQHVNPQEAVQMYQDLGAKQALAIHWGTFELTDESLDQPLVDLATAREQAGIAETHFRALQLGESWQWR